MIKDLEVDVLCRLDGGRKEALSYGKSKVHLFLDCTREQAEMRCLLSGVDVKDAYILEDDAFNERRLCCVPLYVPDGCSWKHFSGNYVFSLDKDFPKYSESQALPMPIPLLDIYPYQEP